MSVGNDEVEKTVSVHDEASSAGPTGSTLGALFSKAGGGSSASKTPWHLRGASLKHEKRIAMAPRGTRRSMGKR